MSDRNRDPAEDGDVVDADVEERDTMQDENRDTRADENRSDVGDEEPRATGPLSNLREDVERRRRDRRDAPSETDDAFEVAATEPVLDGEQVWEDLLSNQPKASTGLAFGDEVEGEPADVRVIPDRVCHNCTYFGDPPSVHCEHDGTEIRRVVDMEHFEVVDCPIVKNRSDLTDQ